MHRFCSFGTNPSIEGSLIHTLSIRLLVKDVDKLIRTTTIRTTTTTTQTYILGSKRDHKLRYSTELNNYPQQLLRKKLKLLMAYSHRQDNHYLLCEGRYYGSECSCLQYDLIAEQLMVEIEQLKQILIALKK